MRFVSEQRQAGEERLVNHHREHTTPNSAHGRRSVCHHSASCLPVESDLPSEAGLARELVIRPR